MEHKLGNHVSENRQMMWYPALFPCVVLWIRCEEASAIINIYFYSGYICISSDVSIGSVLGFGRRESLHSKKDEVEHGRNFTFLNCIDRMDGIW